MLRQLVVNADDLGLTVGVNTGIFDAQDLGILTSASLFAHAPATADALQRTRVRPSLGIGVHLAQHLLFKEQIQLIRHDLALSATRSLRHAS